MAVWHCVHTQAVNVTKKIGSVLAMDPKLMNERVLDTFENKWWFLGMLSPDELRVFANWVHPDTGGTALMAASWWAEVAQVSRLLKVGANPNLSGRKEKPLHLAMRSRQAESHEVVKLLLEAGACHADVTDAGLSPMLCCVRPEAMQVFLDNTNFSMRALNYAMQFYSLRNREELCSCIATYIMKRHVCHPITQQVQPHLSAL